MAKGIVRVGYTEYVMDLDKATKLMEAIIGAEVYETKWHTETKTTTYHIYPRNEADNVKLETITVMPDELYKLAKMAGKPESKHG